MDGVCVNNNVAMICFGKTMYFNKGQFCMIAQRDQADSNVSVPSSI